MKKTQWLLLIIMLTLANSSCKKNSSAVTKIETNKSVVNVGEALTVQISNPAPGSVSKWSVQPATGSTVENIYTTAANTIRFSQPGTFVINAEMRTVHTDCRPSPSWDTCFSRGTDLQRLATTIEVR